MYFERDISIPIEIKASQTYNRSFHKGLDYWRKNVDADAKGFVIYRGEGGHRIQSDTLLNWREMAALWATLS